MIGVLRCIVSHPPPRSPMTIRLSLALFTILSCFCASAEDAADWPGWRGPLDSGSVGHGDYPVRWTRPRTSRGRRRCRARAARRPSCGNSASFSRPPSRSTTPCCAWTTRAARSGPPGSAPSTRENTATVRAAIRRWRPTAAACTCISRAARWRPSNRTARSAGRRIWKKRFGKGLLCIGTSVPRPC